MDCVLACYAAGPGSVPAKSKCSNEWLKPVWLWEVVIRSPIEASVHYHLPSAHSIKLSNIEIIFGGMQGNNVGAAVFVCVTDETFIFCRKSSFKSRLVSFRLCKIFFSLTGASNLIRQQQQKRERRMSSEDKSLPMKRTTKFQSKQSQTNKVGHSSLLQ